MSANNPYPTVDDGYDEDEDVVAVQQFVIQKAKEHGVNPALALEVFRHESANWDKKVLFGKRRSTAGAIGTTQLMPGTASQLGVDPDKVNENIDGGIRYLKQQLESQGGDVERALRAYNAGPGAVDKSRNYSETNTYVKRITQGLKERYPEYDLQTLGGISTASQPSVQNVGKTQSQTVGPINIKPKTVSQVKPKAKQQLNLTEMYALEDQFNKAKDIDNDQEKARQIASQLQSKFGFEVGLGDYPYIKRPGNLDKPSPVSADVPIGGHSTQRPYQQPTISARNTGLLGGIVEDLRNTTVGRNLAPVGNAIQEGSTVVSDIIQNIGRGAANIGASLPQALGASTMFNAGMPGGIGGEDARRIAEAGRGVSEFLRNQIEPAPSEQQRMNEQSYARQFLTQKVPNAAGSLGAFALGGEAGAALKLPGWLSSALLGAATEGVSEYEEARASGKLTPQQQEFAGVVGGVIGTTEALGIESVLNKLGGRPLVKQALDILQEGGQEAFQTWLNNLNANTISGYDPDRPSSQGVLESGAVGVLSGAGAAGVGVIQNKVARNEQTNQLKRDVLASTLPPKRLQRIEQESSANSVLSRTAENPTDIVKALQTEQVAKPKTTQQPQPNQKVRDYAREYATTAGVAYDGTTNDFVDVDEERAQKIADAYENMKNEPDSPEVKKSYDALKKETKSQYEFLVNKGVKFEPYTGKGEPYKNSGEMREDVEKNNHLWFFTTEKGFGEGEDSSNHPLLEDAGVDIGGTKLVYNDLFRAVHDYFGHAKEGYQFGAKGEENAWKEHSRMYSDEALPALTSETRGQNSWVNFGPHLRTSEGKIPKKGEEGFIPPQNRPFAPQKAGLLPSEFSQRLKGEKLSDEEIVANADKSAAPAVNEARILYDYLRKNNRKVTADKADGRSWLLSDGTLVNVGDHSKAAQAALSSVGVSVDVDEARNVLGGRSGAIRVLNTAGQRVSVEIPNTITIEQQTTIANLMKGKNQYSDFSYAIYDPKTRETVSYGNSFSDLKRSETWQNADWYGYEAKGERTMKNPFRMKPTDLKNEALVKAAEKNPLILYYSPFHPDMKPSVLNVGKGLSDRTIENFGQILPSSKIPRELKVERAQELGISEIIKQMAAENSGIGWYAEDVGRMEKGATKIFPELRDRRKMDFFKAILALTSNGQSPVTNTGTAIRIYDAFKENGSTEIPLRPEGEKKGWLLRQAIFEDGASILNKILKKDGIEGVVEFLNSKHSNTVLQKAKGTKKMSIYAASRGYGSSVFGPKLGSFYQNLLGNPDELTMDQWWSRTWNRWMGTALDNKGELVNSPRNDNERMAMMDSATTLRDTLNNSGYDLTIAEIQALLWFHEQQLWKHHGAKVESYTYTDGIIRELEKRGMNNVAKEIRSERDAENSKPSTRGRQNATGKSVGKLVGSSEANVLQSLNQISPLNANRLAQLVKDNEGYEPVETEDGLIGAKEDSGNSSINYFQVSDNPQNNFAKWFGKSKTVDENGKPLTLYHGTRADFESFESKTGMMHFGTKEAAEDLLSNRRDDKGKHIRPVYLRLENPLTVKDVGFETADDFLSSIKGSDKKPFTSSEITNFRKQIDDIYTKHSDREDDWENANASVIRQMVSLLQKKGYDGVQYENSVEGGGSISYAVFDPKQIKSVFNNGEFSTDTPNISAHHSTIQNREDNGKFTSGLKNLGRPFITEEDTQQTIVDNAEWVVKVPSAKQQKAAFNKNKKGIGPTIYLNDQANAWLGALLAKKDDEEIRPPLGLAVRRSDIKAWIKISNERANALYEKGLIDDGAFLKLLDFGSTLASAAAQHPGSTGLTLVNVGENTDLRGIRQTKRHERFHLDQFGYPNAEHVTVADLVYKARQKRDVEVIDLTRIAVKNLMDSGYKLSQVSRELGAWLAGGPDQWRRLFGGENGLSDPNHITNAAFNTMSHYVETLIDKYSLTAENLDEQWSFIDPDMRGIVKDTAKEYKYTKTELDDAERVFQEVINEQRRKEIANIERIKAVSSSEADGELRGEFQQDVSDSRTKQTADETADKLQKKERDSLLQTALTLRKAGFLTGPRTAFKNIGSNTTSLQLEEIAKIPASLVDMVVSRYTNQRTVATASQKQIVDALSQLRKKGWGEFKEAMKGNKSKLSFEGWENVFEALNEESTGKKEKEKFNAPTEVNTGLSVLDSYINAVFNFQSAQDRVFRIYAVKRSLDMQAETIAKTEAKQGLIPVSGIKQRTAEIIRGENIDDELKTHIATSAIEDAEFALFQNNNPLVTELVEKPSKRLTDLFNSKVPGSGDALIKAPLEQMMPFRKTPANVIARIFAYTPLGYLKAGYKMQQLSARRSDISKLEDRLSNLNKPTSIKEKPVRAKSHSDVVYESELENWKEYKQISEDITKSLFASRRAQQEFSEAMGRSTVGTALIALGVLAAMKGLAIGFVGDEKRRNLRELSNTPEGYMKIPGTDKWFKVSDWQPFGTLFTIGASLYEQHKEKSKSSGDRAANIAKVGTKILLDHPMISTLKEGIETLGNPSTATNVDYAKFGAQQAASAIPTIVKEVGKAIDPTEREARTPFEELKRSVPFASKTLPPKIDALGRPIERSRATVVDPFNLRTERTDPITRELQRLNVSVSKVVKKAGETPQQTRERKEKKAGIIRETLNNLITTPEYSSMDDSDKKTSLAAIVKSAGKSKVDINDSPLMKADALRLSHNAKIASERSAAVEAMKGRDDFKSLSENSQTKLLNELRGIYNTYSITFKAGDTPKMLSRDVDRSGKDFEKDKARGRIEKDIERILRDYLKDER